MFMAEVFRPSEGSRVLEAFALDEAVRFVIDIPGDELRLYLVAAPDAVAAEGLLRTRGLHALRVSAVDVHRWRGPLEGVRESPDVAGGDRSQRVRRPDSPPRGGSGASD